MKYLILLPALLIFTTSLKANNCEMYILKGAQAEKNLKEKEAFVFYKKAIEANPKSIKALVGASIMCANIGHRQKSSATKEDYYKAAIIYAQRALKVNATNAEANYALAVAYGRKVYTIMLPKARIAMSAKIKKYAELAIQYNPKHYNALTILGMWHYERATLTFAEKKLVALLGGLPNGSINKSFYYLNRSRGIAPNNIATLFELGKVYQELGKRNDTKIVWQKALAQPNKNEDDKIRKLDIKKRLMKI